MAGPTATPKAMSTTPAPAGAPRSAEEALLASRGHTAVVGLQWGDEGKGQIVDLLAPRYELVVRFNGGNNAGHTVQSGDQKFALHLIPSGILYPDKTNVVGNGVVVDPAGILKEIDALRGRGVQVEGNLRISDRAHVVLPYHKVEDQLFDQAVAQTWESAGIGTTGRGIGPCYADKALRTTAVRMGDLLRPVELGARLKRIVAIKNAMLGALARECGREFQPFDAVALAQQCQEWGQRLARHICDTNILLLDAIDAGKQVLFEGANAALLDVDHGTYPYVTSSTCSSLGAYSGAGVPGRTLSQVVGVVKAYTSRVGGGPHPTELKDDLGERIRQAGHEFGTTTGRPRRVGWLDLTAVRYSARLNGATALVCTGLAVLAGLPRLKLCVGYRHQGQRLDSFPANADVLAAAEPIYEEMEGFAGPLEGCRSADQLPPAARAYLERIEHYAKVPVRLVCIGRRRDQVLPR